MAVQQCMLTEFDYWQPDAMQNCIKGEQEVDFQPVGPLQRFAPIEFFLPPTDRLYYDLNSSKLELKIKIVKGDKTDYKNTEKKVSVVNNLLHSLFSNVDLELGNTPVTEPNNLYGYRAYIEKLLSFDNDMVTIRGSLEGLLFDTAGQFNAKSNGQGGANDNKAYTKRIEAFNDSATVTLIGRPHLDMFHQPLDILAGCSVKLRFTPTTNEFIFLDDTQDAYAIEFVKARLFVRTKEVTDALQLAHLKMLESKNARFRYNKVLVKSHTITNGTSVYTLENLFQGYIPDRVIIGFVDDAAVKGTRVTNPYYFENLNLSSISVNVNGRQIPRVAYKPDFDKSDYAREYMEFLGTLGLDTSERTLVVDQSAWATGYTLYAFKVATGPIAAAAIEMGSMRVDITFKNALAKNYSMIIFSEHRGCLEITSTKEVVKTA